MRPWWYLVPGCGLFIASFAWSIAWYNQQQGFALVAPWSGKAWQGTEQVWNQAFTAAERAGSINPFDRKTLVAQADLYFSKARAQRLYRSEAERNWKAGLEQLRAALRASPASGLLWSRLAMAKLEAGELDAEFNAAVSQALARGRWDPDVQFFLFYAGMHGWSGLSETNRQLFVNTLHGVLPIAGRDMLNHIHRTAADARWASRLRKLMQAGDSKLSIRRDRIDTKRLR